MSARYLNLVNGEWREARSGARSERINPADGTSQACSYPASSRGDIADAVAAATEAFPRWRATPLSGRERIFYDAARLIEEREEEIAMAAAREMGKPLAESRGEVRRAASIARFFAGELRRSLGETYESDNPRTFLYTRHEPLGVVALLTPWNFPVAIPAWKLAPALAHGNCVVLKPASDAPGAAILLAACFHDAGLPPGAVNVVTGSGSECGAPLVEQPGVAAVSFTGSNEVGRGIREAGGRLGRRVQLELGGQNPAVVLTDADLDQAAGAVAAGAFGNAGQKCTATRRAIVDRSVAANFRQRLIDATTKLSVGDPFDPEMDLGPLVNEAALVSFEDAVRRGCDEGATVVSGGATIDRAGYYAEPTILEGVSIGSYLACEEVFAPVLALIEVDGLSEALAAANSVRFGLSASVFTRDLGLADRFAREIRAGVVHVNSQTAGADPHVPFGGTKDSGFGPHEQGRAAREFYTEVKTVYVDPPS